MSDIGSIYAITCASNGCVYIGSTRKMPRRQRWLEHLHHLRKGKHHCSRLQRAFSKYGENDFHWYVVEDVRDANLLLPREQAWIWRVDKSRLFNAIPVADAVYCAHAAARGRKMSDEEKKRRSIARLKSLAEGRGNLRVWTEEARRLHGLALLGRKMPPVNPERGARISAARKGKKRSPQAIENTLASRLAYIATERVWWKAMFANGVSIRRIELATGRARKVIAREIAKP